MKIDGNKRFWDRVAKIYTSFMKSSQSLYDEILDHMTKYLKLTAHVLELTCGSGGFHLKM